MMLDHGQTEFSDRFGLVTIFVGQDLRDLSFDVYCILKYVTFLNILNLVDASKLEMIENPD